jgi:hypothetical protein
MSGGDGLMGADGSCGRQGLSLAYAGDLSTSA